MKSLGIDIAIGSYNKSITVYRIEMIKDDPIKILFNLNNQSQNKPIISCDITDFFLCTANKYENVKIYSIKKGIDLGTLNGNTGYVSSVLFFKTSHLFTASEDGNINIYTTKNWVLKTTLKLNVPILSMSIHPSGKLLLTIDKALNLTGWNLISAELLVKKKMPKIAIDVFWNQSGNLFAILRDIKLLIYNQKGELYSIIKYKKKICCATFLKDKFIVLGTKDKKIIVWDTKKNKEIRQIEFHNNRVKCICLVILMKFPFIITGDSDGLVAIWDGNTMLSIINETKDCLLIAFDSKKRITSLSVKPITIEEEKEKKVLKKQL